MKGSGKMISNMGKEWKCGKRALNMRETTIWGRSKELASTRGPMAQFMKEIGSITELAATEYTSGKTEGGITGSGRITIWRASAFTSGEMEEGMKASIIMTKRVATVSTSGQMVGSTKGGGTRVSSTVWVCMLTLKSQR
jgi:hypothetical protein